MDFFVATEAQLRQAILDAGDGDTIRFTADIELTGGGGGDLPAIQQDITIDGDGHELNGGLFRGFFVYSGDVRVEDLTIFNATAQGGNGAQGGGGGAGLGGALFVNDGATVTISNVDFTGNQAVGGNATVVGVGGGGGGMGGDGGINNGGGGGLGSGANGAAGGGGSPINGSPGIVTGAASGGDGAGGGAGGADGGGGGNGVGVAGGGGGGVGGGDATGLTGGAGGFGGGGGGPGGSGIGGAGGFGGGGGGAVTTGGQGGFGGGGGAGSTGGAAGFGGGVGGPIGTGGGGGGGAGLGGAVFVMEGGSLIVEGSLGVSSGVAIGGVGGGTGGNGLGFGDGFFLQGSSALIFDPGAGEMQTIADAIEDEAGVVAHGYVPPAGFTPGSWGLIKSGVGTLVLSGVNAYTGATEVSGGTLQIDGTIVSDTTIDGGVLQVNGGVAANVTANNESILAGAGTVGDVVVNPGGELSPDAGTGTGILNTGDLSFNGPGPGGLNSLLTIEFGGADPGTGYDQVNVTGTVTFDLDAVFLDLSRLGGFLPSDGTVLTIIANDGADAVSGTFANLAEGTIFTVDATNFQISYTGGDGNDVTLTAVTTDATWRLDPVIVGPIAGTWDFNAAENWDPGTTVPNGTATFGATGGPTISFSEEDTTVGGWTFNADATDYTFTVGGGAAGEQFLRFNGAGIDVNGGSVTIEVTSNLQPFSLGRLEFHNGSTAGDATIHVGSNASLNFFDDSSAGNAHITNISILAFRGTSGAGSAVITNSSQTFFFNDNSSAENANITVNSALFFNASSSAGQAEITNHASLFFDDNSTADHATIITSGHTRLTQSSSGDSARFITQLGGDVSIANLTTDGTTAGSIEGAGNYLLGGKVLTVGSNNLDTEVSGVISGSGGRLIKTGTGTLTLSGVNTYTGGTAVEAGRLLVNGSIASNLLTADVLEEGILGGNGTVGDVQVFGGTLAPGESTGILTTGDLEFFDGAESLLLMEIGGTAVGTGYDQLAVNGMVTLGGAALALSLEGGFVPSVGTSFTLIANDGNDAVSGTFFGLAQGALIEVGLSFFTISYSGGDGNDVVLTAVETPPPPTGVTINGTPQADIVNATQTVAGQPLPTAFNDVVNGFGGDDSLDALAGNDQLFGGKGDDQLFGEDGNDVLFGAKGRDQLFGGLGADFLSGGFGRNRLTGGTDADQFVFDSKLGKGKEGTNNKSSFSKITDFADGDVIELSQAVFKKIALGVLSDDAFRDIGEKATKETRITYKSSGELSYDKDGKGGADAIVFAKLTTKPDIDATDFLVVA